MRQSERRFRPLASAVFIILFAGCSSGGAPSTLSIRVMGNGFVDGAGRPVRLLGVNLTGQQSCSGADPDIERGVFDGPSDDQSIAEHSPDFWGSVAATFRNDPAVLFDLYNEPIYDQYIAQGMDAWACWRDGCDCTAYFDGTFGPSPEYVPHTLALNWPMAGTQILVDRIRAAGAHQPVVISGLDWANDLGDPANGWLTHLPNDPGHQLVASAHLYDENRCVTSSCWDRTYAPVASSYPLVTAELGVGRTVKWLASRTTCTSTISCETLTRKRLKQPVGDGYRSRAGNDTSVFSKIYAQTS